MSLLTSLLEFRTAARQLTDTVGDTNIEDSWLTARANQHITEVWDLIVDAGPPERYAATQTFSESAGTFSLALPADFRNLLDVYLVDGGRRIHVPAMRSGTLANYRSPTSDFTAEVEYIPAPDVLVDDGDSFDGISGWGDLVAQRMARDIAIKRDVDRSGFNEAIALLEARIKSRARSYDKGSPKYVTDLDEAFAADPFYSTRKLAAYRLRGTNLEIYESALVNP